jgi:predicted phage gp36 major capsid-like protein
LIGCSAFLLLGCLGVFCLPGLINLKRPPEATDTGDFKKDKITEQSGSSKKPVVVDQPQLDPKKLPSETDVDAQKKAKTEAVEKEKRKAVEQKEMEKKEDSEKLRTEKEKVEHDTAARKLNLAKQIAIDAEKANRDGKLREGEQLSDLAKKRYREIIEQYPKTKAAEEAKRLLDE